ncbi:DUF2076 domain-containing protein [Roseixanthobacter pseudopolyaromaticivorans]|uniref:DUF2076 domain-containing protein n=1 Tax=Xanthobacteraceae TaxID=335928 RepID=UPI003729FB98
MTPEERALIDGLFDRMRGLEGQPRDREAEALIAQRLAELPHATYALAQTVLVQEHALTQASARIQELEQQVREAAAPPQQESTSFLGGLFGGGRTSVPTAGARPAAGAPPSAFPSAPMGLPPQVNGAGQPNSGAWGQQNTAQQGYGQPGGYPQQGGPWGGQQRGFGGGGGGFGGGGFLQGALATAAGVAGGALLFDGIKGLMSGGTGPVAQQAAALETPKETPAADTGNLGSEAQTALGGDAGASPDAGWDTADAQDAGYDNSDDGGWSDGGSDDSWA